MSSFSVIAFDLAIGQAYEVESLLSIDSALQLIADWLADDHNDVMLCAVPTACCSATLAFPSPSTLPAQRLPSGMLAPQSQ
jgi:hypothetical protein